MITPDSSVLPMMGWIDALDYQRACFYALIACFRQGELTAVAALLGLLGRFPLRSRYIVADGEDAFLSGCAVTQLEPIAPGLDAIGLYLKVEAVPVCELVGLFLGLRSATLGIGEWHGRVSLSVPGSLAGYDRGCTRKRTR
ncbi:hypothetical protein D3C78_1492450 [compost metagenome]